MAITKPPVLPSWAEAGDKVQPSNAEIQAGWPLSSIPPSRQRFNWLLNFLANGIRYFSRRGLPDYDAAETYMTGDRIIGDDGKTYRSLIDNNTAQTPSSSPTKWEPWALTRGEVDARLQTGSAITATASGTSDAITASFTPAITALANGMTLFVRAAAANTTATPTFAPDGLPAKTIVKGNNLALVAGDIAGAGHWLEMNYDATLDKWVLQNPADVATTAQAQDLSDNWNKITPLGLKEAFQGANQSLSTNGYQKLPGGLIIQWGTSAAFTNNTTEDSVSVTLPIAFPTAALNAVVCNSGSVAFDAVATVTSITTTTLTISKNVISITSLIGTLNARWIAIGY